MAANKKQKPARASGQPYSRGHMRPVALRIGKQDFLNLMKEFPEVTVEVMRSLADRLARTTSELANLRAAKA